MLPLTLASFLSGLLAFAFVIISLFLVLVILIQKPKGGGLSGAFGGAGGSQGAVFGAKTGDVLTWFTVGSFVVFLLLGIGLVFSTRSDANPVTPKPTDLESAIPGEGDPASQPLDTPPPASPTPTPDVTPKPADAPKPDAAPAPSPTPPADPVPAPAPAPAPSPAPGEADKPAE